METTWKRHEKEMKTKWKRNGNEIESEYYDCWKKNPRRNIEPM